LIVWREEEIIGTEMLCKGRYQRENPFLLPCPRHRSRDCRNILQTCL
jgi:hypothetical protein